MTASGGVMEGLEIGYVNNRQRLAEVVEAVRGSDAVGFDTEFIGEGSYEPLLCLVQIAAGEGLWIVDPLALPDLGPLWELLTAPERELVTVAAREEIRFCLRYAGRSPARLLDLQVAAGLLGYGYPLSHTNLVRAILGERVAGGEAYTDWSRRPLANRQIEYAADDIRYLLPMRARLLQDAERRGRVSWIEEESRALVQRITAGEQEERWWRVSGSTQLGRRELAVLRELWRWRDAEARAENVPPRRVLRDELLTEVAKRKPASLADLYALRGVEKGAARKVGPQLLEAVKRALALPETEWPTPRRRSDPPQLATLSQLLSVAMNGLATQHEVDPALLATTADLQDLVRWRLRRDANEEERPALLDGWRGEILGQPLLDILEGRRSVRVESLTRENPLAFETVSPDGKGSGTG